MRSCLAGTMEVFVADSFGILVGIPVLAGPGTLVVVAMPVRLNALRSLRFAVPSARCWFVGVGLDDVLLDFACELDVRVVSGAVVGLMVHAVEFALRVAGGATWFVAGALTEVFSLVFGVAAAL